MKAFAAILCLAVAPLAACETLPSVPSTQQTLTDERALLAAEAAFQGVLIATNAAVDSGALKGSNATRAADLLQRARNALVIARRTKSTADAFTVLNAAADLKGML